jgi:hypothetical protein
MKSFRGINLRRTLISIINNQVSQNIFSPSTTAQYKQHGHKSHHSVDFKTYCEENNIITLYMPPHSSHLLHPLSVRCFGTLKKAYGREIEQLIRRSITHVSKTEFFPAFYAAVNATTTESNIKGSLKGARLVPLDQESVVSKLDVQLRTPTSAREEASQAEP